MTFVKRLSTSLIASLFSFTQLFAVTGTAYVLYEGIPARIGSIVLPAGINGVTKTLGAGSQAQNFAISPDDTTIYIASFGDGNIYPYNIATKTIGTPITVGGSPTDIAITPDGLFALVTDAANNLLLVVDLTLKSVINSVASPGSPNRVAITPDGTQALVVEPQQELVRAFDITNIAVPSFTALIFCGSQPTDIAINSIGTTAYVTNSADNSISAITISPGFNFSSSTFPVGTSPESVAFSPDGLLAYVATNNSMILVFEAQSNTLLQQIPTGDPSNANNLYVSSDGLTLFVPSLFAEALLTIDTTTLAVTTFPLANILPSDVFFLPSVVPPPGPTPAPTGFTGNSIRNKSEVQVDNINELSWDAEPDITEFLLFRNGVLIAALPSTATSYSDHNRNRDNHDTYTLFAVGTNGTSPGVTFTFLFE
jgi:streptogramin lyase